MKKRLISVVLCLVMGFSVLSLCGCTDSESGSSSFMSETDKISENNSKGIIGTWVIEKNEVYDGPMQSMFQQMSEQYFYDGAVYEFAEDGNFVAHSNDYPELTYEIVSDTQIEMIDVSGQTQYYDYELNDDSLIVHGCYTGVYADIYDDDDYPFTIYFRRK